MGKSINEKAEKAHRALLELREAALDFYGAENTPEDDSLLSLVWQSNGSSEDLAHQAERFAEEAAARKHPYRTNRLYCCACQTNDCEHSFQPQSEAVFVGYENTGLPRWIEFFRAMLELEDDRTDLLFDKKPELLAHVVNRHHLIKDQLASFGRNSITYRIWGQVIAGYLYHGETRAAMTIQVVETRDHRLHLQLLADDDVVHALLEKDLKGHAAWIRIHNALGKAENQLKRVSLDWQREHKAKKRHQFTSRVYSILRHLATSIERKGRQGKRRTVHAESRARDKRPVHMAQQDLKEATTSDFYADRYKQTIVVIGKSSRAHVFSEEGKHITSLNLGRDEIDRRVQRNRFAPLETQAIEVLRNQVCVER